MMNHDENNDTKIYGSSNEFTRPEEPMDPSSLATPFSTSVAPAGGQVSQHTIEEGSRVTTYDDFNPQETVKTGDRIRFEDEEDDHRNYFARRPETWRRCERDCRRVIAKWQFEDEMSPNDSQKFLGIWLCFSINQRDKDQERVLVLTDCALFRIRYDFIREEVCDIKFTKLTDIKRVQMAGFAYPPKSLAASVRQKLHMYDPSEVLGVRVHTKLEEDEPAPETFGEKAASWFKKTTQTLGYAREKDIMYRTFRPHVNLKIQATSRDELASANNEMEKFYEALVKATEEACGHEIQKSNEPIEIKAYVGVMSSLNQNYQWGAQKTRRTGAW